MAVEIIGSWPRAEAQRTLARPSPWAYRREWRLHFALLGIVGAVGLLAFTQTRLDLWVADLFYGADGNWLLHGDPAWDPVYDLAPILAFVQGAVPAALILASFSQRRFERLRIYACLGPGLVDPGPRTGGQRPLQGPLGPSASEPDPGVRWHDDAPHGHREGHAAARPFVSQRTQLGRLLADQPLLRPQAAPSRRGTMAHVDIAFPLDGDDSIHRVQWLVSSKERL